jgi:DNA-binding MarR family transcriptional regulator
VHEVTAIPAQEKEHAGVEAELGWSLHRVSTAFRQSAAGAVADLPGGPRGYQVLVAVVAGAPSSQLALAHRLGIDKTAMTYLVDDMEAAGLVLRRPDPADRRRRQVVATPAGRTALAGARSALREVEDRLLGALDARENAQLRDLLARVARSTGPADACAAPAAVPEAAPTCD